MVHLEKVVLEQKLQNLAGVTEVAVALAGMEAGGGGPGYTYSGAGGSSYISGKLGCIGVNEIGTAIVSSASKVEDSYSWTNKIFTDTIMIDGKGYKWIDLNNSEKTNMMNMKGEEIVGNSGNGYCRITLLNNE